ncbi:tetratricopeptide repeat protein [Streptomyces sp. NPDC029216]|uniref:tetratricopeptide repeat protein n=1 Tax=Streptomyces sp. NPDC029216 TaxID=3154701 RepID=UPI0033E01113
MSARSRQRIAIVQSARQGSGYLIGSRLVLTSAHLLAEGAAIQAAVPGGTGAQPCRVVWLRDDGVCDAALLAADAHLVADPSGCPPADVVWGRLHDLTPWPDCEAVGYPQAARRSRAGADSEQLVGTLKPGSSLMSDRYVLDSIHSAPGRAGTPGGSPWQGMSGAAVFAGHHLIGVVSGDPVQWGHSRVEAVPVSVFAEDPAFQRTVEEFTGIRPRLTTISRTPAPAPAPEEAHPAAEWISVSEADPIDYGIHHVQAGPGLPQVIAHIAREVDTELDQLITDMAPVGGFVLLTGDSAAGKTRALLEAMKRNLADWLVCRPDPDADLSFLYPCADGGRRVVWLDDLHAYLRPDGLTPQLLGALKQGNVVVLATMRSEFYDHYAPSRGNSRDTSEGSGPRLPSSPARVVRAACRVELGRTWTEAERASAAGHPDPRVVQALAADTAYGLAEYLAAGPQVLALCKSASRAGANPRGAALVAAAVDLARTGLDRALPPESLERLHEHYLSKAGGHALRPEPLAEAWQWADRVVLGVTSPLIPAGHGRRKPFDYLVSDAARRSGIDSLPLHVWDEAVRVVDDTRRALVSTSARFAGRPEIAKAVLRPLADAGDPDGLVNLGALLAEEGDHEGAAELFALAAEAGDGTGAHNLGVTYMQLGDLTRARAWLTTAVERGEGQALGALGLAEEKLGDKERAVEAWRRGTEAGDAASALYYSEWMGSRWNSDEALEALRVAADGDLPVASLSYAGALLARDQPEAASRYTAKADDDARRQALLGNGAGALMAGVSAYFNGDLAAGDRWWALAAERGAEPEWTVLRAEDGSGGLPALAVSGDALARLGEEETRVLMASLWAGDCLSCGYSLGDGVPALHVDDHVDHADARLFHFGACRYPRWNESALMTFASDAGSSWRSFTGFVRSPRHPSGIVPALFVNPSLEWSQLRPDGSGRWSVAGMFGPRSTLAPALGLQPLWKGVPSPSPENRVRVFAGGGEVAVPTLAATWSAQATEPLLDLVRQSGGLVLVVTSAVGPGAVTVEAMAQATGSWDAMAVWAPLERDPSG